MLKSWLFLLKSALKMDKRAKSICVHGSLGFIKYLIHLLVYWPLYLPSSLKIGYINQNQISNHWIHQSKPARKSPKPPNQVSNHWIHQSKSGI